MFAKRKREILSLLLALFMLLSPIQALFADEARAVGGELTVKTSFQDIYVSKSKAKRESPLLFKFRITGPEGYESFVELFSGQEVVIEGLKYGVYKVEEVDLPEEFAAPIINETGDTNGDEHDGEVMLSNENNKATVEFINRPTGKDSYLNLLVFNNWPEGKPLDADKMGFDFYANGVLAGELSQIDESYIPGLPHEDYRTYYLKSRCRKYENATPIEYRIKPKNTLPGYKVVIKNEKPLERKYDGIYSKCLQWEVFNIPLKNISATKLWDDFENVERAGVKLTLYRSVLNGVKKPVEGASVFTPSLDKSVNGEEHVWENVPLYADDGERYFYFVREEFTNPGDPNNKNWRIDGEFPVGFEEGGNKLVFRNTALSDGDKPGTLIVKKKYSDLDYYLKPAANFTEKLFKFKVTGPNGYEETFELAHGQQKALRKLEYGVYTVNEELPEGEPNPVFNETGGIHGDEHDGVVELNDTNKTTEIEVVNPPAYSESLIEVLVLKYWLGGKPFNADEVDFDLYENGICRLGELEHLSQSWAAYSGFPVADNMSYYVEDGISKYENGVPVKHNVKERNMSDYKAIIGQPTEQYYKGHKYLEWKVYNIPLYYVLLVKHWNDLDNVDRAGVKLTLYRSVEGESPKAVEGASVFIPSIDKAENYEQHMWEDLPMYSDDLKPYTYFVKEEFIDPNDPNNQNWVIKEKHDLVFKSAEAVLYVNNTAISSEADQGRLIIEKKFDGGTAVRGILPEYKFKVVGPDGYETEFGLGVGDEKVLNGLKYGVYTVTEELQAGMPEPTFNETGDTEGNAHDGKVRLSSNSKVANVEVINHPNADEIEWRILIKKIWLNGKPEGFAEVGFDCYADYILNGQIKFHAASEAELASLGIVPNGNEVYYLGNIKVKIFDENGMGIRYEIKEKDMLKGYKAYTFTRPEFLKYNGENFIVFEVTNIPTKDIEVTKHWKDVHGIDRAGVKLTLYRSVEEQEPEVVRNVPMIVPSLYKSINGESFLWQNVPLYSKDGKPYKYLVKEEFLDPNDPNNANWFIVEKYYVVFGNENCCKLDIYNTAKYINGKPGVLTIKKTFNSMPAGDVRGTPPSFKFNVTGPDNYEVEFELSHGQEKVLEGLIYGLYTVKEELKEGFAEPTFNETGGINGDAHDGVIEVNRQNLINTVEVVNRPKDDDYYVTLIVKKTWVGGKPEGADNIGFDIYEDGELLEGEEFGKFDAGALEYYGISVGENEAYYATEKLFKYGDGGVEIVHTIEEKNMPSGYKAYIPAHPTEKVYKGEKFLQWDVKNVPVKDITVVKHWYDLDNVDRANVKFTLYRWVDGGAPEVFAEAPEFFPSTDKAVNNEQFTWDGVPMCSDDGKPYTYVVREEYTDPDDPKNNNWQITPESAVEFIGNWARIRAYNQAVKNYKIIATKTWEDATDPKPEIKFELWRKGGTAGAGEKVVDATELVGDTVNFGERPQKDANGVAYTYFVKEVFTKPEERDNWIITGEGEGLTVNNKLKTGEETGGKLRIVKKASPEGAGGDLEFEITITGPYGFNQVIKLKAGEETMLHNLRFGEYKVEETETHGFTPSYDPESGEVTLTNSPETVTVVVTNTKEQEPSEEEIIATKTWENATDPKPEIKFELWRKGGTAGAGEKVVDATELTDDKVNFGKQPKKDGNGVAYTYFVKEVFTNPEERANWTITGEGEGLTVNNKLKTGEETGGRLRIVKKTSPEGAGGDKEFEITVTGPYGFTQVIKLKAGQETMLNNLHFGEYKVEETETHGFTPSYDPESGEVTLTSPPKTVTVTVTNKKEPVDPPVTSYDPIYIEIAAEKKLLNGKLKAGDFTFELYKGDKLVETVTNDASGNVTFKARKFVSPATIKYTVKEVAGSDTKHIVYDGTIYTVIVTVNDVGGNLVASISYEKDGVPYGGKLQFVNRVKPPKTGDSYTSLPLVLVIVSMLSLAGVTVLKKKRLQK